MKINLIEYLNARTETKRAYANYNHAALDLELSQIKERLAKLGSQVDPAEALLRYGASDKDRMVAAAYYVVIGRFPDDM